jgi:hypothetical protein
VPAVADLAGGHDWGEGRLPAVAGGVGADGVAGEHGQVGGGHRADCGQGDLQLPGCVLGMELAGPHSRFGQDGQQPGRVAGQAGQRRQAVSGPMAGGDECPGLVAAEEPFDLAAHPDFQAMHSGQVGHAGGERALAAAEQLAVLGVLAGGGPRHPGWAARMRSADGSGIRRRSLAGPPTAGLVVNDSSTVATPYTGLRPTPTGWPVPARSPGPP